MLDGRKWRAVPFLMLFEEMGFGSSLIYYSSVSPNVVRYSNDEEAFQQIKSRVDDYQNKIITGFDNLGFLVSYRNGRLRLGPALGGNHKLENDFYNGSADKTRRNTSGFVTVSRNNQGLQYEVEQLEFLINKKEVREEELQKFFEENPHFWPPIVKALRFPISASQKKW